MFLAKSFIPWIVLASALRLGAAQEKLLAEKDNGERMHNKLKPNSPLATLDHPGEHPGESPILPEPISAPKVLKSRADTGAANAFNALGAPLDHPGGHSGETPDQPDPAITPSDHPGEHLGETPSLPAPAPAPLDHPGEHTGETPSPPAPLDHPGEHTGETPSPPAPALAPLDHPGEHLGESPNPPPSAPVPLPKVLGTRALTNLASNEVEQNEGNVITASLRNPGKLSANSPAPVPLPALKLSTSRVEVSHDANGGNQIENSKLVSPLNENMETKPSAPTSAPKAVNPLQNQFSPLGNAMNEKSGVRTANTDHIKELHYHRYSSTVSSFSSVLSGVTQLITFATMIAASGLLLTV